MGKDSNGKELGAGIYQRKDGRYEARIRIKGQKKPYSIYDTNLRKLKQKKKQFLLLMANRDLNLSFTLTVSQWFEIYLKNYARPKLKTQTLNNYVTGFERVEDYIGYMKIIDVKNVNIVSAIQELEKEGYATTTIQQSLAVLKQVFRTAFENRIIPFDPCSGYQYAGPPKSVNEKPPDDLFERTFEQVLTPDVLEQFFKSIQSRRYYELFIVLLHGGLRIGELLSLQWKDINFRKKQLKVYKTVKKVRDIFDEEGNRLYDSALYHQVTTPKSEKSYRIVPLSDIAVKALKQWKAQQDADKKQYGRDWGRSNPLLEQYPDLVCTTGPGNPLNRSWLDRICNDFQTAINEPEILLAQKEGRSPNLVKVTPHMFRHTYVTTLIKAKVPESVVREYVGHSSDKMVEYYTHLDNSYIEPELRKGMKSFYTNFDLKDKKVKK